LTIPSSQSNNCWGDKGGKEVDEKLKDLEFGRK